MNSTTSHITGPCFSKTDPEDVCVVAAKAGDTSAFEDLVRRYEGKIFRLALHMTGNWADAEEVLQETFIKAFEHLQDFHGDSRFYTWLVRIAINEGLMKLRKLRSDRLMPFNDFTDEKGEVIPREFADWRPNPEQLFAQEELRVILENVMQSLCPALRTVFFLRDIEGLSTEETAELLDSEVGTVKARLHRARFLLREKLSKVLRRDAAR